MTAQSDVIRHMNEQPGDEDDSKLEELLRLARENEAKIKTMGRQITRLMALMGEAPKTVGASSDDLRLLHGLTTKQHVALQMVLHGASNREIGEVLGVGENTAKVHVRSLASKLQVSTRAQISYRMLPVLKDVDADEYMKASKGLPKDWAEKHAGDDDDPYRTTYRGT